MKIGILTFHCAHNYGAVLQCYALQETIKSLGHSVEIIDYRPSYLIKPYKKFYWRRFVTRHIGQIASRIIAEILLFRKRIKRYEAFNRFINQRLQLSEKVKGKAVPSYYDTYVIGSDQIWNPRITKGFDPVYFGYLGFPKGSKKYIAYAASMEAETLDSKAQEYYAKALDNFDAVSVREEALAGLLRGITPKSIDIVLDPTLLVDKDIWEKIATKPSTNKKYVLVYQVRKDANTTRIANEIAQQIGGSVFEVTAGLTRPIIDNKLQCASPEEFLGLVKHAACVVTTSFHGTAFSTIFNRPFYCIEAKGKANTRVRSLLSHIGLTNRILSNDETPTFSEIDYESEGVNSKMEHYRNISIKFLKNSLQLA